MKIVFFGTAPLACPSLVRLLGVRQFQVVQVVTQPDRPKGRQLQPAPSAVKIEAQRHQLPIAQPEKARSPEFIHQLAQIQPDLMVVAAYGQLLPQKLLDLPRFGSLNVHTSLLPKYRGAAPIQWAIINGDSITGVTIMKMDAGMDTGPIVAQQETPIRPEDNATSLHERLAWIGADLLVQTIPAYVSGSITPCPQPVEGSSHARKITKEDGRIDWSLPASQLWNRIRGLQPWPGAYTSWPFSNKIRHIKILEASVLLSDPSPPGTILQANPSELLVACGENALQIKKIQPEGRRAMTAGEFLAGHNVPMGEKLD